MYFKDFGQRFGANKQTASELCECGWSLMLCSCRKAAVASYEDWFSYQEA